MKRVVWCRKTECNKSYYSCFSFLGLHAFFDQLLLHHVLVICGDCFFAVDLEGVSGAIEFGDTKVVAVVVLFEAQGEEAAVGFAFKVSDDIGGDDTMCDDAADGVVFDVPICCGDGDGADVFFPACIGERGDHGFLESRVIHFCGGHGACDALACFRVGGCLFG